MTSNARWASGLALFAALGILIGGFILLYSTSRQDELVGSRERTTNGLITERQNGGRVGINLHYTYSVDGSNFEKRATCKKSMLPCAVGQEVTVYFDHDDPATSKLVDFRTESVLDRELGIGCIVLGVAITGIVFLANAITAARQRADDSDAGQ